MVHSSPPVLPSMLPTLWHHHARSVHMPLVRHDTPLPVPRLPLTAHIIRVRMHQRRNLPLHIRHPPHRSHLLPLLPLPYGRIRLLRPIGAILRPARRKLIHALRHHALSAIQRAADELHALQPRLQFHHVNLGSGDHTRRVPPPWGFLYAPFAFGGRYAFHTFRTSTLSPSSGPPINVTVITVGSSAISPTILRMVRPRVARGVREHDPRPRPITREVRTPRIPVDVELLARHPQPPAAVRPDDAPAAHTQRNRLVRRDPVSDHHRPGVPVVRLHEQHPIPRADRCHFRPLFDSHTHRPPFTTYAPSCSNPLTLNSVAPLETVTFSPSRGPPCNSATILTRPPPGPRRTGPGCARRGARTGRPCRAPTRCANRPRSPPRHGDRGPALPIAGPTAAPPAPPRTLAHS